MVNVNGMEMPLKKQSGLLVLEDESGHQVWALIVDAMIEYGEDAEVSYGSSPQFKVIATMKPGELLRTANTLEADEVNVLTYSRLLVAVLRQERDRYAELERTLEMERRSRAEAVARKDDVLADRDGVVHEAWKAGAKKGWFFSDTEPTMTLDEVLKRNPHPAPDEDDESEGCHICGGPDH